MQDEKIIVPPVGYVQRLMEECKCSEVTVTNAIRHNHNTKKCREIRAKYRELFM